MLNKDIYRELCEKEESISIYDQPWWMDIVCGSENWNVILYEKKGNILGAMPYYYKTKFGIKYITQPKFTQHNGIWIKYGANMVESKRISFEKEVITAIYSELEKMGFAFYQQAQPPTLTNWLPFYWKGCTETTCYTYRINNISDPEGLLSTFQPNKRKNIKKALNAGFEVKFDLPAKEFYELCKESLKKQGKQIFYSFDLFEKIYNAAYKYNAGRTIYAVEGGIVRCALFNLWDKQYGYDLISAIDPDFKNSGASDLLIFSMIKFLSDKVTGYDFEGSMIEGVEESFRHFGATQTPYFFIYKCFTKNPIIKLAIDRKIKK